MKLAVTFLTALVACATVEGQNLPDFGQGPLHDDLQYFLDMIPMEEVSEVILKYASEDPEFQVALAYMGTDEFKQMVVDIERLPEVLNFLQFFEDNGIYAYHLVNSLNEVLGINHVVPAKYNYLGTTKGLAGLFNDVKALISYDEIIHGYAYKMKTSPAFQSFVNELKSNNFQRIVDYIYAHPTYLKVRSHLVSAGVNVKLIEDVMFTVLGIRFPDFTMNYAYNSQLEQDFQDFLKLAMNDQVVNIFFKYYMEDPEVKRGFEYLYNPEFHAMVRNVEALPEYKAFVLYLQNSGVDAIAAIQRFHEFVNMEDYVPPMKMYGNHKYQSMVATQTGGYRGMVDEIKAALPLQELYALYQYKIQNSPAFADFIAHIQAPEFQNIINEVYAHPIFIEMRMKAKLAGLDLDAINELIALIFGIQMPRP